MLESARATLAALSSHGKLDNFDRKGRRNDKRGTRSLHAHLAFETVVTALLPDDATDSGMLRTIEGLLGLNHDQVPLQCRTRPTAPSPQPSLKPTLTLTLSLSLSGVQCVPLVRSSHAPPIVSAKRAVTPLPSSRRCTHRASSARMRSMVASLRIAYST